MNSKPDGILSTSRAATTIGMFFLIVFAAFEAMAVTTVMPEVARDLAGVDLYALSFAAPLASGVVGMVAAGMWSDRRGPALPLVVAMALFSVGLAICGTAPSMEVLVCGRIVQGLGGGALTVGVYVVVGKVYPARLQPAMFASFAAAWVLPALFGPALAAWIAEITHWRWVFLSAIVMVALAGTLVAPALRGLGQDGTGSAPRSRLAWAAIGGTAVLALELFGSSRGVFLGLAGMSLGLVVVALRRLTPKGTLRAAPGLAATVATRGLLSASFFCAEAYIVFVLQEQWGLTATRAGLALTAVGLVWAAASQVQSRLGALVSDSMAMQVGMGLVLAGVGVLLLAVATEAPALLAAGSYVLAGAGMGFAYPRTSVAVLAASDHSNRGFNTSAMSIADSLGAALALSVSGIVFAVASRLGLDRFTAVYVLAVVIAAAGVAASRRTGVSGSPAPSSRAPRPRSHPEPVPPA